jgi:O-antigen/teichoic acid export membrane protein
VRALAVAPARPRDGRGLSVFASALALILSKVSTMGIGFVFWLLAARLFAPTEVGLAAGAVSAMMLCTQLALVGIGSSVIVLFPRHERDPTRLLDTAFTIVVGASLLAGCLFLLVASSAFDELGVVASEPRFALAFLALCVLGTAGILFDQVSTALRRGDQALARALLFGLATVAVLGVVSLASSSASSRMIFSTWLGGGVAACGVGLFQLRRQLGTYRYRPRVEPALARRLLRIGLPNHALTLTERAPGLILPIVVTELLSPAANAAWYAAWMMAWVLYIIPIQVGMTQFAEAARAPAELRRLVRQGIRTSLLLGAVGAVVAALSAHLLLSLLGRHYSADATTPLRILVVAVLPLAFVQGYFVACRSTRRLGEAVAAGAASAAASLGCAAAAGAAYGLTGMATAWVVVQLASSVWAVLRLRRIFRDSESTPGADTSGPRALAGALDPELELVAVPGASAVGIED